MSPNPFRDVPSLMDLLPEELGRRLRQACVPMRYADGALIHGRGDAMPGLSIVRSGAVRMGNTGLDGTTLTTAVLGPGECFGEFTLFAGLPRTHDAIAAGPTIVDQIDRPRFERLLADVPELLRHLLTATTLRLHRALEELDDQRRLSLAARSAKQLLRMARSATATAEITGRQSDLASVLGVSRVSLGKALAELSQAGLIQVHYGGIAIPDVGQLRGWLERQTLLQPVAPDLAPPTLGP